MTGVGTPAQSNVRRASDRRSGRVSFVYPERRRGFERRALEKGSIKAGYRSMICAYRHNPRALLLVLAIIATANLADLVLTQRALAFGAVEVNPLMASLFDSNPVFAAIFKLEIGLGVVVLIWALRGYRAILELSLVLAGAFGLLVVYHLSLAQNLPA